MLGLIAENQRKLAGLLIISTTCAACAVLFRSAWLNPETNFLPHWSGAEWIIYPPAPEGLIHPRVEMETVFRRTFQIEGTLPKATLQVGGFQNYSVSINGERVEPSQIPGRNWKQRRRFDISAHLRNGQN